MSPQKAKILIIEDEAIVAMSLKMLVLSYGYDVVGISANYSDSLMIAKKSFPELILTDIKINGDKNGIETAWKIKEICGSSVIFITAYSSEEIYKKCMEINPSAYLKKPFKEQVIRTTIEDALNERNIIHAGDEVLFPKNQEN